MKTRKQRKMEENKQTMKELLSEEYTPIQLQDFQVKELDDKTEIDVSLNINDRVEGIVSYGDSPVDALWKGIVNKFSNYSLLSDLTLNGYKAEAVKLSEEKIKPDSEVRVSVSLEDNGGDMVNFNKTSKSVLKASVNCFVEILEYLINSEKAFKSAKKSLNAAKEENRQDLVVRYRNILSELTRVVPHTY